MGMEKQLQAAETWAGGGRELLPELWWEWEYGHQPALPAVPASSFQQPPGLLPPSEWASSPAVTGTLIGVAFGISGW